MGVDLQYHLAGKRIVTQCEVPSYVSGVANAKPQGKCQHPKNILVSLKLELRKGGTSLSLSTDSLISVRRGAAQSSALTFRPASDMVGESSCGGLGIGAKDTVLFDNPHGGFRHFHQKSTCLT